MVFGRHRTAEEFERTAHIGQRQWETQRTQEQTRYAQQSYDDMARRARQAGEHQRMTAVPSTFCTKGAPGAAPTPIKGTSSPEKVQSVLSQPSPEKTGPTAMERLKQMEQRRSPSAASQPISPQVQSVLLQSSSEKTGSTAMERFKQMEQRRSSSVEGQPVSPKLQSALSQSSPEKTGSTAMELIRQMGEGGTSSTGRQPISPTLQSALSQSSSAKKGPTAMELFRLLGERRSPSAGKQSISPILQSALSQPSPGVTGLSLLGRILQQQGDHQSSGRVQEILSQPVAESFIPSGMSRREAVRTISETLGGLHIRRSGIYTPFHQTSFSYLREALALVSNNKLPIPPFFSPDPFVGTGNDPSDVSSRVIQADEVPLSTTSDAIERPSFPWSELCEIDTVQQTSRRVDEGESFFSVPNSGRRTQGDINAEALRQYPDTSFSMGGLWAGVQRWYMGAQPATSAGQTTASCIKTGCGVLGAAVSLGGLGAFAVPSWLGWLSVGGSVTTLSMTLQEGNYPGAAASALMMLPSGTQILTQTENLSFLGAMQGAHFRSGRAAGGVYTMITGFQSGKKRVDMDSLSSVIEASATIIQR